MFVTHPSVRIRGTENNYNPVQCLDPCCNNKNLHMHCPFCQKSEIYHDPVILKAHYRVKHVDKGIDFAGLKVLRCCDHCDIVGAIKGEKKFKGAHWHCYKCKNGFNRRDEAIKHYKTHFRNPQTTFQIHIAQEVNNPIHYYEAQEDMQAFGQDCINTTIHPVLTEAIISAVNNSSDSLNNENDSSLANGQQNENDHIHVSVGANETVTASPDAQAAIMIIQHEDVDNNSCPETIENGKTNEIFHLDAKCFEEFRQKEEAHIQREQQLQNEIDQLKLQIQNQEQEISDLKKREAELIQKLQMPLNPKLQELLNNLQAQHLELLQQQVMQVKREALSFTQTVSTKLQKSPSTAFTPSGQLIALVMDQSGNVVPLNQEFYAQSIVPRADSQNVDFVNSEEIPVDLENKNSPDNCKSQTNSLVIIDLSEDVKKRKAGKGELINDSKRKKS